MQFSFHCKLGVKPVWVVLSLNKQNGYDCSTSDLVFQDIHLAHD